MKVNFHKSAIKFIDKLNEPEKSNLINSLRNFVNLTSEQGSLPISNFNIRKLSGKWEGFKRLRIGNIRVIFQEDFKNSEMFIYVIDYRGNLY